MNQKLSALLIIVLLLVGTVSVSSNFALADDKDKDKGKKNPPLTLASFCAKIDDKNSFQALVCVAISDLYTKIQNISLTPGPAGKDGATGPAGPQGPAGTGTFSIVMRTNSITAIAGSTASVKISCNPGEVVTGGGGNAPPGWMMSSSYLAPPIFFPGNPPIPGGWIVIAHSDSSASSGALTAQVFCATIGP